VSDQYRGFQICNECPPIPIRGFDWVAVSDNYDASYEGPEDGWKTSGETFYAATRSELIALIDEHVAEEIQGSLENCKSVNRYVKTNDGNRYWVFGVTNDCVLARRVEGGLLKPLVQVQYSDIAEVEKQVEESLES
jgi:hypothetical protein